MIRQGSYWAALGLLLVTLVAYSNSFRAGFTLDSRGLVLEDPRIQDANSRNLSLILDHTYWWPSGESGLYRPLTTLSFLFNYATLGDRDQPALYHLINFLLHALNVLLVFALGLKLIRSFWPAWFAAALWAAHPVLTESVTNIAGRADLLAGLGVLAGFWMYLKSTEGSHRWAWLAGVMLATAVGVFSKESAVVIAAIIPLFELTWYERRKGRAMLLGILATLPPIGVMLYQRSVVLAGSAPAEIPYTDNPLAGASFWTARLTALKIVAKYLWLAIWPVKLSSDYSYPAIPMASGTLAAWVAWLAVAAALIGIGLLWRWNRTAFFWAGFSAITFAPVSNLLFPTGTIMAERLLYLPLIGVMACLVLLIFALPSGIPSRIPSRVPGGLVMGLLGAITIAFAARTVARNADWHDDLSIAEADARAGSFKLHRLLASALSETNDDEKRALEEADRSVALLDSLPDAKNAPDAYLLDGGLHLNSSDYPRAIALLEKCVAINKSNHREGQVSKTEPEAYRLLSEAYLRLSVASGGTPSDQAVDSDLALDNARRGMELAPTLPNMYLQVAAAQLQRQQADQAAVTLMTGMLMTLDPGLRDQLMKLYAAGVDTEGCALSAGPKGPAINPTCPLVKSNMCAAGVQMIRIRQHAGERDVARTRSLFLEKYGCPPEPFEQALQ